jgi:hypothetical protein
MAHLLAKHWPLPHFHLMALAPLDVWIRLLRQDPGTIPLRYWPRLVLALLCSSGATLLTLPERLAYAFWTRLSPPDSTRLPPPLFILGYYRSGTTHLHYMLGCDPAFTTPRWFQTLAPQGFALSWALLRFLLVPFLPATRVQDAMRFGANAPSEDDFALNNWALASALPGRTVVPQARAFYDRFHDLEGLTAEERERWQSALVRFVHKLSVLGRGRRVLLKTPSHTARIPDLLRLFPRAQFIHISRRPDAVLRSNVALLRVARERFSLQESAVSREQLVAEYAATEERYLRDRALIPRGQLAESRFEDLLADPLGEVRRLHRELGLELGEELERRLIGYLDATHGYAPNVHEVSIGDGHLSELAHRLGHDEPPVPKVSPPRPAPPRLARLLTEPLAAALGCALVWLFSVLIAGHRTDWLIWPTGIVIGLATRAAAGRADAALGRWAAALALLALIGSAIASTWILHPGPPASIERLFAPTLDAFRVEARLFWSFMGLASAYKLAAGSQT